jgi:glycyl-tRNA synthetase beta chain
MSELLLEICSAEIPARMQESGVAGFGVLLMENFAGIGHWHNLTLDSWVTPRRMGYYISNLDLGAVRTGVQEFRGPKINAPEQAVTGFLSKHGATTKDLVTKDGYYILLRLQEKTEPSALIANCIKKTLEEFVWPKSMLEGQHTLRWVRPMKSILCLLDNEVLDFAHHHIKSGNHTHGHRFMSDELISIRSYEEYKNQLSKNHVILSQIERRAKILRDIEAQIANLDGKPQLIVDDALLSEVCGLVEYPHVLIGHIDPRFMHLPKEVLVITLKSHQRYLMLQYPNGELAPYYVIVANIVPNDEGITVLAGNNRVLTARLSDAAFFFSQDLELGIDHMQHQSSVITFHADIGTLGYKQETVLLVAQKLCTMLNVASQTVEIAISLAKADLSSVMVREFPELQGVMGAYYAEKAGYDQDICTAIREHYKPQGPHDVLPSTKEAAIVCIADKLAVLHLLFNAGIKPTGSKDPYALRRAALGIWRIVGQFNLRLDFKILGLNSEAINFLYDKKQ